MKTKYKSLRALFRSKKRWCQGLDAKDANGNYANPKTPAAVSFCLAGGAWLLYKGEAYDHVIGRLSALVKPKAKQCPTITIVQYNDDPKRKFSQIQSLVRKAKV